MSFYSRNSRCFTPKTFRKKYLLNMLLHMLIEKLPENIAFLDICTLNLYLFIVNLLKNFYLLFLAVLEIHWLSIMDVATARIYLRLVHICVKFFENFPVPLLSFHHKGRKVSEYICWTKSYSHVSSRGQRKSHLGSGFLNSKLQLESLGQTEGNSPVVELLRAISKSRKKKESSWSSTFTPSTKTRN